MNTPRWWPVLVITALVAFITALDNTIVAAAAPSIGRELGLGIGQLQWTALAYMIPFALSLLVSGGLIDRWGQRATLGWGLVAFGAGALLSALARTAPPLLAGRVVQGCAAAFLVPGTLSLLRGVGSQRRRTTGTAVWTAALAVALAAGPAAGGLFSQYLHWSWIFYGNLPFALAALALLPLLRCTPAGGSGSSVRVLRGQRRFQGALLVQVLWGLGVSGVVFFTPLVHQDWVGLDPTGSGLPLALVAVALVLGAPLVPGAVDRLGTRSTVVGGLLLVATGLLAIAAVNHLPEIGPRVPGLLLTGFGSAFTVPLTSWSLGLLADRHAGTAAGMLTASRELSSAAGVALIGGVLLAIRSLWMMGGSADPPALAAGYTAGLLTAAVLQLAAAALAARILHEDFVRHEVLGAQ
ncbi:MFS transporter [Kutzneria viridogrisea]|uniref:Major facilitator transporter n=2 Tax=Kutzneria TaxID=43356 RepID=W5W831_9PSEU|nr:MFS transporter [Kutzneria albida]AHH96671.1 major facilitator transporter [Kutzneria albida DSM 43870]MBA8928108.1 MFS family permease [Kutzneria viridogrisea]